MIKPIFLAVCVLIGLVPWSLDAEETVNATELFRSGTAHYEAAEFTLALPLLKKAAEQEPSNSIYQHFLGKCYGRIAEHGSWVTALRYVNKTRRQFERAVELDEQNYAAWQDLEEFYRRAPAFFGGDKKRALEIKQMLQKQSKP